MNDVLVGGNDSIATFREERYPPEASFGVSPPSQDDFSVERDFTSCFVKEDLTTSVCEICCRDEIVGDSRSTVCFACFEWKFVEEKEQSFGGEQSVSFWLHD